MKLLLVRHGESAANVNGVLSSYPGDGVALTELGRMQAEQLSCKLPRSLSAVYSSPLERAIETAEIALGKDAGGMIIEPRIKEVDYGEYSGQPNNAELDSIRQVQIRGDYRVRFGVNGESRLDVFSRLYDFLIDLLELHEENSIVLAVTHGSIISRMESILIDAGIAKRQFGSSAKNAEIREYGLRRTDTLKFVRLKKLDNLIAASEYAKEFFQYRCRYVEIAAYTKDPEVSLEVFEKFYSELKKCQPNWRRIKESLEIRYE